MFTTIITNYKRLENVKRIISNIKQQSVESKIFIWDNSKDSNDLESQCDWYVKSTVNMVCCPRWWMATQAETEWVVVMDDDITLKSPNAYEHIVKNIKDWDAAGSHGVRITNFTDYLRCHHISNTRDDEKVDIIKGRFLIVKTDILKKILPYISSKDEDDIIISSKLKNKAVLGGLGEYLENLSEMETGLCKRPDHYQRRTNTMIEHFRES